MIPRTLVPYGARPPAADAAVTTRRRPSAMDERKLVPAMLPIVPLDGRSNIPANLPLEAIAARVVVPRDLSPAAYAVKENTELPLQATDLDERIAVPQLAAPPEMLGPLEKVSEELVEPDIFLTGKVQLMASPKSPEKAKSELITRLTSIAVHVLLILTVVFQPREHAPQQQEISSKQLTLLLPPGALESPKPSTRPAPPREQMHVDPRVLRQIAPPIEPAPVPQPEHPVKELPSAPVPQPNAVPPSAPAPKTDAQNPPLRLGTPDVPQPQHGLVLPKVSPRNAIEDSLRNAAKNSSGGGRSGATIAPMPKSGGVPGSMGGGAGPGTGSFGNGYEILTPTEGVDFSDYMARVLASVRRNWYAVMPESAMLGDRGRVVLQFRIMKNGNVPPDEPNRLLSSGKEPLDRAAVSAIRSSNPFQPLPPAFKGEYIELRFMFLYNLPLEAANQ